MGYQITGGVRAREWPGEWDPPDLEEVAIEMREPLKLPGRKHKVVMVVSEIYVSTITFKKKALWVLTWRSGVQA